MNEFFLVECPQSATSILLTFKEHLNILGHFLVGASVISSFYSLDQF